MQLIVITPEHDVVNEPHIVNQLFASGLQRLHLRKPSYSAADYRKYILAIDAVYYEHIVFCDCFELLNEFALGGIHLNSAMQNDVAVLQQLKALPSVKMSASFHSWEEIKGNIVPYNYVFISPVFDSISKKDYKAGIGLDGLASLKKQLTNMHKYCPQILGLGGVGQQQIQMLHQYGFDGAAVLGAVWQPTNPVTAFKEIQAATTSLTRY